MARMRSWPGLAAQPERYIIHRKGSSDLIRVAQPPVAQAGARFLPLFAGRSLSSCHLRLAPPGAPQIEITFHVDDGGSLLLTSKDLVTGWELAVGRRQPGSALR